MLRAPLFLLLLQHTQEDASQCVRKISQSQILSENLSIRACFFSVSLPKPGSFFLELCAQTHITHGFVSLCLQDKKYVEDDYSIWLSIYSPHSLLQLLNLTGITFPYKEVKYMHACVCAIGRKTKKYVKMWRWRYVCSHTKPVTSSTQPFRCFSILWNIFWHVFHQGTYHSGFLLPERKRMALLSFFEETKNNRENLLFK